jgi:hypothetical protein
MWRKGFQNDLHHAIVAPVRKVDPDCPDCRGSIRDNGVVAELRSSVRNRRDGKRKPDSDPRTREGRS